MRLIIAILLALCAATAHAAAPAAAPEVIAETDLLRVQLAQSQAELRARDAADAKREAEAQVTAFRAKYHLGDGDSIDPQTRVIRRAPMSKPTASK